MTAAATPAQATRLAQLDRDGITYTATPLPGGALLIVEDGYSLTLRADGTYSDHTPEQQIRAAVAQLGAPGDWIGLADLRATLPHLDRATMDATLRALGLDVDFTSEVNQKTLTPADRAAVIRLGGEDKHLISIR